MFNGKIHYKWPFSIAMLNYQRVFHRSWSSAAWWHDFTIPKVGLLQGTLPHAQPKPAHGAVGAAGHDLPQELAFGTKNFSLSPAKRIVTYITCYIDLYSTLPILYLPYLNISLILASWNIKTTSPGLAGRTWPSWIVPCFSVQTWESSVRSWSRSRTPGNGSGVPAISTLPDKI